jgi:hypothetical protein
VSVSRITGQLVGLDGGRCRAGRQNKVEVKAELRVGQVRAGWMVVTEGMELPSHEHVRAGRSA